MRSQIQIKIARIGIAFLLLGGFTVAQEVVRDRAENQPRDLLTAAQADRSLAMFVTAAQSSGMARMLREEGPLTVFALSNRAFGNLPKEDRETLFTDHAAMHLLLSRYIARGIIPADDTADLSSARTLAGIKLRTDLREEGSYVNGSRLDSSEIRCTNGIIHVLYSFDPGLVHEAVALARTSRTGK